MQQLPATSGIPPSSIGASAGAETSPTLISNGRFNESARKKVTPKRPRKRLEEAFSGQTATPPQSASKGTRKLAPKLMTETMQHNTQDSQNGLSDTPIHNLDFSAFPSTSEDMFGFPMSAPATASGFDGNWDTDMSGMDMDFIAGDGSMFAPGSHKISNSFDWGKSNQLFQDNMNITQTQEPEPAPKVTKQPVKQPVKKPRALAQKPPRIPPNLPKSTASFDFNNTMAPAREEHFSLSPLGGSVDPGLLFSRSSSLSMSAGLEEASLPAPRPASSHIVREPYQHQQRELRRDQEELRRSRSNRERSSGRSFDRQTVSSPVKGSARPGLHRSMSDNRGKTGKFSNRKRLVMVLTAKVGRIPSRIGRASPVKRQRAGILTAIPESPIPPPRTEVIFTIDSKGKARTETIIVDEQPSVNRRAKSSSLNGASSLNGDWESSHYESSTDEEPILVPSRNSSFSLPQAGGTRFEISNRGANGIRRQSSSVNGYSHSESSSQHSMQRESVESEAETVITNDGDAGDATQELRKVMENRKKVQPKLQSQHHRYGPDGRHGSMYYNSSINISPTALTDPDGNTPSSTRSGTTRCVCQNDDSEGFMIQW